MKKSIVLLILFCYMAPGMLRAEPKHYASAINEVTVYLQGAMVKRTATISLEAGTNEIILDGLSNKLDINSIHLESSSAITILAVTGNTNYLVQNEKTAAQKQLEYSLDTSNQRLARIRNEITSYNNEMDLLKTNYKITPAAGSAYTDVLENAADFTQKRMKEVLNDLYILGLQENDYVSKMSMMGTQINEIAGKNKNRTGTITITASSTGYASSVFTITYYVPDAGWTATYNVRAENTDSIINLDYDAEVSQTTGEDWKNVKLILSTGNPSVSGEKPKMMVNKLDFENNTGYYDDGGKRKWRRINTPDNFGGRNEKSEDQYTITEKDSLGRNPYNVSEYTTLNQNILATTFEINLKYDILSDGNAKHVRIQQYTLPAQFSYSALPKACQDAFLEANITGWNEYNLLPGEANIFLENGYVGKSYIDPTTTHDTLLISFGKDKRINIKRVRVKEFTRSQFLGVNKIQSYGFATSVRNIKNVPIIIIIEDQIPVSTQKEIEVELKESSGARTDPATGKLTWKITLQPDEEKTLKFEYTVKYPKGKVVTNL